MEHERDRQLIPLAGGGERLHAVFTPLTEDRPPRRSALRHAGTVLCAFFCLLCLTAVFLIALSAAAETDFRRSTLRLAEQAFFGTLTFRAAERAEWLPDGTDSPTEIPAEAPEETEAPAESPSEEAETPRTADGPYPITQADLSCGTNLSAFHNETEYIPDAAALLAEALPFADFAAWSAQYGTDVPYVLILHTHGTEAYAAEDAAGYHPDDSFRSHNREENVVAVGAAMAQTLEAAGIPTLHCTEMFDAESYQDSYSRSAAAIRTYLQQYPSIQIVLDVHRDSIIRSDLTKIQPVTQIGGTEYAQFMIVAGTDDKGADFPHWRENLNFALKLQANLMERSDSLVRAINLRGAAFNQQYRSGSLLLEVGSCGNTLAQAKRTGVLAAIAIAETVTGSCSLRVDDILGETPNRPSLPLMRTWDYSPKRS